MSSSPLVGKEEEEEEGGLGSYPIPFWDLVGRPKGLQEQQAMSTREEEEEDPTSSALHECRCCLQTFPTHLELLVHSFTHSRWDLVRRNAEEKDGPGDGQVKEEGLEDGGLKMEIKVEEEGPALGRLHLKEDDVEPGDGPLDREMHVDSSLRSGNLEAEYKVEALGEKNLPYPAIKKEYASSYYFVQGIELRRFSVVVDRIIFCPKCFKTFVTKRELKEHERDEHSGSNELEKDCVLPSKLKKEQQSIACADCGKTFSNLKHLKHHREEHTREESFNTELSEKVFSNSFSSNVRARKCHKSFTCDQCTKSFRVQWRLSRHMAVHSDDKPFSCDNCNKSFKSHDNFKKHQKDHIGLKEVLSELLGDEIGHTVGEGESSLHINSSTDASVCCPFCERILKTKDGLINHVRLYHIHDKVYSCKLCSEKFQSIYRLSVHKKEAHDIGEVHMCKYCGKIGLNKFSIARHERSHTGEKPFKCSLCSKSLSSNRSLQRHKLMVHSNKTPCICDKCGKGFKLKEWLKKHIKTHESGMHQTDNEQYPCKHCPKVLASKYSLQDHMRSFHGADMSHISCPDCSYKCPSKRGLYLHRQKFHGYKTRGYAERKCSVCHLVVSCKSKLEIHMRHHTGERPFRCTECGEGFISRQHLTKHMYCLHSRQHGSPDGSYKSADRSLLQHRKRRLHSDTKQFGCNSCGKVLKTRQGLVGHLRKCQVKNHDKIVT